MSGLSRTPGKRVYDESRTVGSNPTLSASSIFSSVQERLVKSSNIMFLNKNNIACR